MYLSLNGIRQHFRSELSSLYSDRTSDQLFYRLLESFYGIKKTEVVLSPERILPEIQQDELSMALERLLAKEPVQYIDNTAYFMDSSFYVDASVLIPRPETEELVNLILDNHNDDALKILDIGTGSGIIAISLLNKRPNWTVLACDVSNEALITARRNSREILQLNEVAFYREDILNPQSQYKERLDVIVSNPPYVLESDKSEMEEQVLNHEPHVALFVDDKNPLQFYKAIIDYAQKNLITEGCIYFEVHESYNIAVATLLEQSGYNSVKSHSDLQGKMRMVSGQKG
jgi:release factor glutamine methyltransferase